MRAKNTRPPCYGDSMADALDLLHQDHQQVTELYSRLGETGDRQQRRALVDEMIAALTLHATLEEQVFYPALVDRVEQGRGFVKASLEDHRQAEELLATLREMPAEDPQFDPTVGKLMKAVKTHVNGEELQLFPRVRDAFSAQELDELGRQMAEPRDPVPAAGRARGRRRARG